ncbi:embrane protein required for colicin V [Serratia symbiotica str. 'Cinara cedri']|nr:embrane protein required for colicin V [Serratia symbiotica str. 'Cinara cedri']
MIWIDYVIIALIGFSALVSLIRGFIREILSLLTWSSAFFVASYFYSNLASYLTHFENELMRNWMAIFILFIVMLTIGTTSNYVINYIIEKTGLSGIDRILGICFGTIRGVIIFAVILFFLDTFTELSHSADWQKSKLIPQFSYVIRWLFNYLQSTSSFLPTHLLKW